MDTSSLIQAYLANIKHSSKGIYDSILCYALTGTDRRIWGFPLCDPNDPSKVIRFPCIAFDSSPDPNEQICRCGKVLSLLQKNWFIDEVGCSYHWGKRCFLGGPENGLFSCCKSISKEHGCMRHKYHACSYKPMKSDGFVRAQSTGFNAFYPTNVFALDCEMVYTTVGLEVARVSLVTIFGTTVYDSFVRPPNEILDFNTSYSGIKPNDLVGVKTTVADARDSILKLLNQDSILIGHGLENDLVGLHLLHEKLVDTSILYAHENGFPYRHSLKALANKYLNKDIKCWERGHDSVEDAKTSIALILRQMYWDAHELGDFAEPSKCGFPTLSKRDVPTLLKCDVPTLSKCDVPTLSGPYTTYNLISVPKPPGNSFYSIVPTYQKSPVIVIPKIIRIQTGVFQPLSIFGFPYTPMALCQF